VREEQRIQVLEILSKQQLHATSHLNVAIAKIIRRQKEGMLKETSVKLFSIALTVG
jgi:hypothetical protein